LSSQADRYRGADAGRLARTTVDLVAAWCAYELDVSDEVRPETRQVALWALIESFIHERLGDARLTPDTIAAHHHISTRYLHKIFQDRGLTVGGWIREKRLEKCRRDLADPALNALPIYAIAARWGFTSAPHFSRAFRATHGISPGDCRGTAVDIPAARTADHAAGSRFLL